MNVVPRNRLDSAAFIVLGLALVVCWASCDSSSGGDGDGSAGADVDAGGGGETEVGVDGGGTVGADADSADGTAADLGSEDPVGEDAVSARPWPEDRWITPTEVYERLVAGDSEMLPLNVVDEEFYDMGHIEGSLIIPWDLLPGRLPEVDRSRHIVVYCRRGVRTQSAYRTLIANGYELVWTMEGGLEAWLELEYPVVHDE